MPESDPRERLAAIGEIAAEVAHELRNALQIISANVYLAKQDLTKSEPNLAKIEKSARIAHSIVDDLMALARGEPARAEPIFVAEAVAAARETLPEGAATFDDHLAAADFRMNAHLGLLSRLFHVLYDNAIRASAPRVVRITTRVHEEEGRVVLEVSDDGPGVPPTIAKTLFDPLVTAREGGTGLGLALARRVVTAHGGTIALVPGAAGATFRVEIPRTS